MKRTRFSIPLVILFVLGSCEPPTFQQPCENDNDCAGTLHCVSRSLAGNPYLDCGEVECEYLECNEKCETDSDCPEFACGGDCEEDGFCGYIKCQ